MSRRIGKRLQNRSQAHVFAALGDVTRLSLLARLADGQRHSITQLTSGTRLTRQAITKHLRVLHGAGMVRCSRLGRESLFEFDAEPLDEARAYLELVAEQWGQALFRLKAFVEEPLPEQLQPKLNLAGRRRSAGDGSRGA